MHSKTVNKPQYELAKNVIQLNMLSSTYSTVVRIQLAFMHFCLQTVDILHCFKFQSITSKLQVSHIYYDVSKRTVSVLSEFAITWDFFYSRKCMNLLNLIRTCSCFPMYLHRKITARFLSLTFFIFYLSSKPGFLVLRLLVCFNKQLPSINKVDNVASWTDSRKRSWEKGSYKLISLFSTSEKDILMCNAFNLNIFKISNSLRIRKTKKQQEIKISKFKSKQYFLEQRNKTMKIMKDCYALFILLCLVNCKIMWSFTQL